MSGSVNRQNRERNTYLNLTMTGTSQEPCDQIGIHNCSRQPIASPAGVIRRSGVFVFSPARSRIKE